MIFTSIITVNYNQLLITIEFLESVKRNILSNNIEVILVDNGSKIDYGNEFKKAYPYLVYIRSERNLGFAGGNNLGIQKAKGKYLFFLNNDTEVTYNVVDTLIKELEHNPKIGIISPLILYYEEKNKIQYAGFTEMNYLTGRNKGIGANEIDIDQYLQISRETGFIHGAAMMCKREDLKSVGLMEENYFLYYEELDWCEKFKKAGKEIWFTGKAKIYHKESISVGKESSLKTYFMHRNRMLYIRKNAGFVKLAIFSLLYIGVICPKSIIKYCLKGRKDLIPWVIKAITWNLINPKNSTYLGYKLH